MKNKTRFIIFAMNILMAIFATGCIRQKDCDCGLTGRLIYYNNAVSRDGYSNAIFVPDGVEFSDSNDYIDALTYRSIYHIIGNIPYKFRKDTDNIAVCLEENQKGF